MPWLNAPNLITLLRLAAVPFLCREILAHRFGPALALCLAAGVTDGLDGWVARRFHARTRAGAYLDPIADKIFLVATYVASGHSGIIPVWLVAIVLGRDVLTLAAASILLAMSRLRDFPPSLWGKISTFFQIAFALAILMERAIGAAPIFSGILLWAVVPATCWSGFDYAHQTLIRLRSLRRTPD
ncbi:MAG: CDP-alcohol phosphatidyltransferase family protein [Bryobacteraceae bacterium]